MKKTKRKLIPAVGYIRMSTDKQEDSPARQRADIETFARANGFRIVLWFEDHGKSGTESKNRPEFQRLLKLSKSGEFAALIISEQSRMSREDVFTVIDHWRMLRDAGVSIYTCKGGELRFDDLGGLLTAIIGQQGAHQESLTLAHRSVSGRKSKAAAGGRISGNALFGFDRVFLDETGHIVRRCHFSENIDKPRGWSHFLEPSDDTDAVASVRWAFSAYRNGQTFNAIAGEFNRRKHVTTRGNRWSGEAVRRMLSNPAYAGMAINGRFSCGKFSRLDDDGLIVCENAHDAIIDRATFEDVQQSLHRRKGARSAAGVYLLRGLLVCGHCGLQCQGATNGGSYRHYRCYGAVEKVERKKTDCPHAHFHADRLERAVLDAVKTHVLTTENIDYCRRFTNDDSSDEASENQTRRLAALQAKIDRASENLALAETNEDFVTVAKFLRERKAEYRELSKRAERLAVPKVDASDALAWLLASKDDLAHADRNELATALAAVVASITLRIDVAGQKRSRAVIQQATLQFSDGYYPGGQIELPATELGTCWRWKEIAAYVRCEGRPLPAKQIAKQFSINVKTAQERLRKCVAAGMLSQSEGRYEWRGESA